LGSSPVVVGGSSRSISVSDAQCMMNLLPGTGGPAVLSNCQQVNCAGGCNPMGIGGLKNALAANALALELNIRYNVLYNGLSRTNIRNQHLQCIDLHTCIYFCEANGPCQVRFFDANGDGHYGAYTIGGLQDLVNLYLDGNQPMTIGQKVIYGTALNQSLLSLNSYFADQTVAAACDNAAPDFSDLDLLMNEYANDFNVTPSSGQPSFQVSPNPTSGELNVRLQDVVEGRPISIEIHNALGQKVMHREYGAVGSINERLDLGGLSNGLYFIVAKMGDERMEQRLVIGKN
jgi:hypothetical protein